jgi:hypothetical protein
VKRRTHAGLSLIVPALFGGAMLALAASSGKVGYLVDHLPLTPTPNGFTAVCVAVLVGGCWWRLRRVRTTMHELDVLLDLEQPTFEEWWLGTSPFTFAPEPVPRRRTYPAQTAEDLTLDPDQAQPELLPRLGTWALDSDGQGR